ncbi:unnamed protein product [Mytilus coruscus]|uniref:Integrase core domain-containing protein n=1 Tax=Mytilus coruscus TaxID=42192 RepID=A0A6J8CDV9_MYTCO|nr:unnamed protein product [Mytilus coruscus]
MYIESQTRSMRDNLIFKGIADVENYNELENTEAKVKECMGEVLKIKDNINFHVVIRLKPKTDGTPRSTVAKFERRRDRNRVLAIARDKLRENPRYSVYEQFPFEVADRRRQLIPILKDARSKNHPAVLRDDKLYIDHKRYYPHPPRSENRDGTRSKGELNKNDEADENPGDFVFDNDIPENINYILNGIISEEEIKLAISRCISGVPQHTTVEEIIEYYFKKMYTAHEILGFLTFLHGIVISRRTLCYRITKKLGLKGNRASNSGMDIYRQMKYLLREVYSNLVYRSLWKLLNTQCGIRVTQKAVILMLGVLDPEGVSLRSSHRLRRRRYCSKGPSFTTHIDGYDKLKPFGISIHGAVDGFSRNILWLKAMPSNKNPRVVARFYIDYIKELKGVLRVV